MKTLIAAAALLLAASGAEAQYAVRSGGMVNGTYSYGYYPALGVGYPTYRDGYYAGPAAGSPVASPTTPGLSYPTSINSVAPGGRIDVATVGGTYVPPYNYAVVGVPYFARHYQGYGADDFPFYGRIYGRPYDAWSWPYLSGGYANALARYYDPPVK